MTTSCDKRLSCKHSCMRNPNHRGLCSCKKPCEYVAPCGHKCDQPCSDKEAHKRLHIRMATLKCRKTCWLKCLCGNPCEHPCWQPCKRCTRKHDPTCPHDTCTHPCGHSENCIHLLKGCQQPCLDNSCRSSCGMPCIHSSFECPLTLEKVTGIMPAVQLTDCKCRFNCEALDKYIELKADQTDKDDFGLLPKSKRVLKCPKCETPICTASRYTGAILARHYYDYSSKYGNSGWFSGKALKIMKLVVQKNRGGGRWRLCTNGHPYYVGECGNPAEDGSCIECNRKVGRVL